jgi:hypothetical protein
VEAAVPERITKARMLENLNRAKREQRERDARLSFVEKLEIVLALQALSGKLREEGAGKRKKQ